MNTSFHRNVATVGLALAAFAVLTSAGCSEPSRKESAPTSAAATTTLEKIGLLVVGDESLGPLIERQWAARREGEMNVVDISVEQFSATDFEIDTDIDVVIYPPGMLGELFSRSRLSEVSKAVLDDQELLNKKELLRHARSLHSRFGRRTMALPLGTPNLVMVYRKDVLEKLNTKPPQDWKQFQSLMKKLADTQTLAGDDGENLPTELGLPLSDGWAAHLFLARAAAYARYRGKLSTVFDRNTMDPLIATEPFVRALTELKESVELTSCDLDKTPAKVYNDLVAGDLAVGFTWPMASHDDTEAQPTNEQLQIVRVPGSKEWFESTERGWSERPKSESNLVDYVGFEGYLVSINSKSGRPISAQEFIKWLPSKSISLATIAGAQNSGPFRASHLGNPMLWTGEAISPDAAMQYSDIVKAINDESVVLTFPRLPGRQQYLTALDEGVLSCLKGESEPTAALESVSEKWKAISEKLDVLKQKANLKRGEDL